MKKGKVFPNAIFQALKEVRRVEKDLGVEVTIEVMETKDYIRKCLEEDEQLKKGNATLS